MALLLVPLFLTHSASSFAADEKAAVGKIVPPPPLREFRGAWIATIGDASWPSKPGLPTAQQKAELTAILDRAVALKLNAVIFQVRPACDAVYQSSLEPWSEYLTGIQGRAPSPYYDPLEFAIAEAHKRGLELHAWFNPFRAHYFRAVSPVAANHITKVRPDLVRSYGRFLWLDPGEPQARAYSLRVIMDVVKRYDVDGIHLDDYIYPYPETNFVGKAIAFPDQSSWKQYGAASGMSLADWRRQNVDDFMQQLYHSIKAQKPWVKFGISPFGIWRPANPRGITGMDAYAVLYGDSRKWLMEGWCDYLAPQLYWAIQPPAHSFPALLAWWNAQNVRHRHVWAGMDDLKVGDKWSPLEIVGQIDLTRRYADPGQIHWNASALMNNNALDSLLSRACYQQPALIPACPWLETNPPAPPKLTVTAWGKTEHAQWQCAAGTAVGWWVLQIHAHGVWANQILPGNRGDSYLDELEPDAISVRAVDRVGSLSEPAIWTPRKYPVSVMNRGGERTRVAITNSPVETNKAAK
jgi:uncharacterized lipoprotein YddW (UPF0748 family)